VLVEFVTFEQFGAVDIRMGRVIAVDDFPEAHPGTHLDPQSIMLRLRKLGVDLLGGRNSALQNLVAEVPPPLVAELLG
jgi:hypothetical protein